MLLTGLMYCHVYGIRATNNNGLWIGRLDLLALLVVLYIGREKCRRAALHTEKSDKPAR
jgi:hypothetical protein